MKKKKKQQDKKQSSSSRSTKHMESRLTSTPIQKSFSGIPEQKQRSPLREADKIVNHRRDERDREYGGFSKGMVKTAKIATELCGKEITPEDTYKVLMALKLSRLAHSIKFDSLVDLIGYTEGLWNYLEEVELINLQSTDYQSRGCCGRCNGVDDICIVDRKPN